MLQASRSGDMKFLKCNFDEYESFKEAVSKWSLDFKQLDSGRFEAELLIVETSQIQVGTTILNRKFEQNGLSPKGFRTFVITATIDQNYEWRKYQVTGKDLLIHPGSGEFHSISDPGWEIFTVSIADDIINQFKENFEINQDNVLDNGAEVVNMPAYEIENLRIKLNYIINLLKYSPDKIHNSAFKRYLSDEIPTMFLKSIFQNQNPRKRPVNRIRDIALNKALDYLNECKNEFPTVIELCNVAGASQRTLEYAFYEKYGVGPKEYMKKVNLNYVRSELLKANPKTERIQNIAQQFGFWHMGHFGSDYKKMFGELPNKTLSNWKQLKL